jgi:TolA-binding protein
MKKIIVGVMALTLLLITAAAFARPWGPGMKDVATSVEQQKFFDETRELRKAMHDKKFELREAYRAQTPDEQKIAKLEKELSDMREKIRSRAEELGIGPGEGFRGKRGRACYGDSDRADYCRNQSGEGCGMRQGRI